MKVTVVGAGNVGATCADVLAYREIANEIILLDIKEGFAEGKALDIWQTAPINQYDSRVLKILLSILLMPLLLLCLIL